LKNIGLTSQQATEQLKQFGFNELQTERPKNILRIALEVMKEPMFSLMIGCSVLYILLGDVREGIIMLCTVNVIITITFYQSRRTEKALAALKNLSAPRALVIRDGIERRIAGREVVPGDLVILNEGDRIPADGEIQGYSTLVVDESLLTGESVPVNKNASSSIENKVFSGTLVVRGKGTFEVKSTGTQTEFGKVGKSLQSITKDQTRLQKEMKILIRNFFIIGIGLSIAVIVASYLVRGNFLNSLLQGVAASMAMLPEEFPVVMTIFLAMGAWRLSKNNVLTRNPSAIETLGSASVLCSDKTGTITMNKMIVAAVADIETIITKAEFQTHADFVSRVAEPSLIASHQGSIDPMEKAIAGIFTDLKREVLSFDLLKEYPLTPELTAMTHVVKVDGEQRIACKGAPETVFRLCKMPQEQLDRWMQQLHKLASEGYRLLAVAETKSASATLPESQSGFDFEIRGLLAFEDPVREEVPAAIQECHDAGIRVTMITGDYAETARAIANKAGLRAESGVVTGEQLDAMQDEELQKQIQNIVVFARVNPQHKLRIVRALQANNDVVAMTGDGVNDAPALKAADIGIAMGNKGTDVAREASSLVLLDDNFASIVHAIRSGRRIYDNLQKAMSYILAIHIPIIGLTLLPAFNATLPLLLMPLHIILMELIIDPICSIAFESEREEKNIMKRPPADRNARFFGVKKILGSLLQGALLLAMTLIVYFLSIDEGHTDPEVRTIAFSALIIGNVFLILTNLSATRSIFGIFTDRNPALWIILLVDAGLILLLTNVPALQKLFSFGSPGYSHYVPALIGAAALLAVLELRKYILNRELLNKA
jgi:Ca2+-transporting ATPase